MGSRALRFSTCSSSPPPPFCVMMRFDFLFFMMDTTLERHDGADWAYHSTLGFFHTHTHWHIHSDSLYTHWLFDLWLSLTPYSALLCSAHSNCCCFPHDRSYIAFVVLSCFLSVVLVLYVPSCFDCVDHFAIFSPAAHPSSLLPPLPSLSHNSTYCRH